MAARLTGAPRETESRDGPIPAMDSAIFAGERPVQGDSSAPEIARRPLLPDVRVDQAPIASGPPTVQPGMLPSPPY
jgi:hypothetical protein